MEYITLIVGGSLYSALGAFRSSINQTWSRFFLVVWVVLCFFSILNPYDLDEVGGPVYGLLVLFVVSFLIGINLNQQPANERFRVRLLLASSKIRLVVNGNLFRTFSVVVGLVLALYFYRFVGQILVAGAEDSRGARFELGGVFSSVYEVIFFNYFVIGGVAFLKFVIAFAIVFGGVTRRSFVLSLIPCLLDLGFGAGRLSIVELGLMIVFLSFLRRLSTGGGIGASGNLAKFTLATALAYIFAVLVTQFRVSPDDSLTLDGFFSASDILLEHFVVYFTGSFRALEYGMEHYESILGFSFGRLVFAGFDEIFAYCFRLLGFDVLPYSGEWGVLLAKPISVGKDVDYFNALYTAVFNFYFDFGVVGVGVGGLVFGWMCAFFLRRMVVNGGAGDFFVLSSLFVVSILSPLSWRLSSGSSIFVLLVVLGIQRYGPRLRGVA